MKTHKAFYQITAAILALVLLLEPVIGTLPPAQAADAEEGPVSLATDMSVDMTADPMLGVQSGVEPVAAEPTPPRSRAELLRLDGVHLSEEGELSSVEDSTLEGLSAEECELLFSSGGAVYSNGPADPNAELRTLYGLTDSEIAQGTHLHGDRSAFIDELGALLANQRGTDISAEQMEALTELVVSGYTCSQAILALLAKDSFGLSLEELKSARVAERELLLAAEDDPLAAQAEEPEVTDYLSDKTGLPKALVEQLLDAGQASAYQITQEMDAALSLPAAPSENRADRAAAASATDDRTYFSPKEVLGSPYSYDKQGNFDVNLSDGSYSYTETDLSIPGKNGLDLVLTRQFHSDQANTMYTFGFLRSETTNSYDISGQTAFQVYFKWYHVQYGDGKLQEAQELLDHSQYTFSDSTIGPKARQIYSFTLGQYEDALERLQTLEQSYCQSTWGAHDKSGNSYSIRLVPVITGMTQIIEKYTGTLQYENSYLVDEFGLGHGWSFGISHLRRVYSGFWDWNTTQPQFQLTTSDGVRYSIDQNMLQNTSGNAIENYDGSDLQFHRCPTGEYPQAVYGLYHKDGKVEYFDDKGRNIAIVDRFGNAITFAYLFEDSQETKVSKITITDTLNNTVVYEKVPLSGETHKLGNRDYNGKWRLSLNNNNIIREYYTYTTSVNYASESTSSGTVQRSTSATYLIGVKNEKDELTEYNQNHWKTRLNPLLRPASRGAQAVGTPLFSNDGYNVLLFVRDARLPNGAANSINVEHAQQIAGPSGYQTYTRCMAVNSLEDFNYSGVIVQYDWGDFDAMDGTRTLDRGNFYTTARAVQFYPSESSPNDFSSGGCFWNNTSTEYKFNSSHQLQTTVKTSYNEMPGCQEYYPSSLWQNPQTSWISETTSYKYAANRNRRPIEISTVYTDSSSQKKLTATDSYTYDSKYNLLTHKKPNGSQETYTYDATYSLPLTHTVQQTSSTTITVTNTLTSDKKSISTASTKRGSTAVGKTVFTYNSTGQLTAQNDYLSASAYVTTNYEYGQQCALPTKVSVSGVKTAGGAAAMGTPGLAAGTVARAQTYNARGWITSQTDANGKTTSYQYDAVGRITKVTYTDNTFQTYSYDVSNDTVTYTDEVGSSWLCTYSKSGKLLTVKDLSNSQVLEAYTYDQRDRLLRKVTYGLSTPDQTAYYRYDTNGRVVEQGQLDVNDNKLYQELYEYQDGAGLVKKTVVGDGSAPDVVTASYQDNMGNTTKTERFLGSTVYRDTFSYDYLGNQTLFKNAYNASRGNSYSTQTTYDHAGRVLTTKNIAAQTTTKTYDWLGNLLTDTDPAGKVTRYTYDALGRLVRVVTPLDSGRTGQTDYTYDANGNIIEERTYTGADTASTTARVTSYEYDARGRLVLVKGNGKEDGKSGTNQFQYTQYVYDALGNVTKLYTGLHAPLTISGSGSVTSGGDSSYSVTQYDYDRYSRLVTQTDPLGNQETYTYDLNGNLTAQTDRRDVTTWNTFDAMGRVTCSAAGSDYLYFSYTPTNQLSEAKAYGKTTTYTYDSLGRLISEETPYATKTFTYNAGDLRTSFKVADGDTVYLNNIYTYDSIGRLTKVNGSNVQASYSYTTNGSLSSVSYNNNTSAVYTYNDGNLPTKVQNKKNTAVLSWYDYTYGLDGNQLTKKDNLSRITTYTYDGLNRLTKEAQTGSGAFTNSYTYDDYSNRAAATLAGTAASYTYDANNRLLSTTQGANTTTYAYDDQGNLTSAVLKYNGVEQNVLTCYYDGFNRLKKVGDNSGETVYTYDADGRRTSKTTDGITEKYVWDGDQLAVILGSKRVAQFTLSTSSGVDVRMPKLIAGQNYAVTVQGLTYFATAREVAGDPFGPLRARPDDGETPEIPPGGGDTRILLDFGPVSMEMEVNENPETDGKVNVYVIGPSSTSIALYDGDPERMTTSYVRGLSLVASVRDGARTYYHYNAHGDVVQLTNNSGTVTKNYTYDAFGVEKNAATSDANPFRYCGEQFDSETGNYYLRARYYSPGVGRFTQEDTHWNPGNMIYGDEPQKWNEWQGEEDTLGLHAYTYKPEATAVAQAGNLYAYGLSNPIMYRDADGNSIILTCIIVGALIGATISAGVNIYSQIRTGKSMKDINWASVGISFVAGGISGGLAGSPLGMLSQVALNALISGTESALQDKVYGRNIDWKRVGISAGIGGLAGFVGGDGATKPIKTVYGRFVSNGSSVSTVFLSYTSRVKAEAAAKALAKGMTASYGTQIIVTDNVVKIVYK